MPAQRRSPRAATGTRAVCGRARSSGEFEKLSSGWMQMSTRSVPRLRCAGRGGRGRSRSSISTSSMSGTAEGWLEREAGLRVTGPRIAAARAVLLEAARDLRAPFGLGRIVGGAGSNCYRLRDFSVPAVLGGIDFAERTTLGVIQQKGATLRADAYHWSVLRCGSSSGNGRNHSTTQASRGAPDVFERHVADEATRAGGSRV